MKKKLLLITAAALVYGGNAMAEDQPQIPNGDFETWTYDGVNLPNNWNSFQTADGSLASFGYSSSDRQVKRSTDTRPGSTGSYSCAIWARKISLGIFGSVIAQGNMTSGRVHAGGMSATAKDNYNYTDRDGSTTKNDITNPCAMKFTGKPKAVKVWVKYIQGGTGYGDHATAKFSAVIHGDGDYISYGLPSNDDVANKALVVASVTEEIPYTDGNWVELNLPFEYTNNGATPAYIQINASTNAYPGAGKEGDYLYIDDIEMVYESAADNVIALINAIGTVEYTDASKAKIDDARTAYDALTTDEKTEVTAETLKVLTDAEAKYAELKKQAEEAAQQAEQAAKELAEAKTALSEGISEAKKYYESIKADYASVAATLQAAINAAAEVLNSATVTKAQADDAKAALAAAVKKAQTDVTVITGISTAKSEAGTADVWYDMNGRRLPGKPTTKGLYIRNGKKVAM